MRRREFLKRASLGAMGGSLAARIAAAGESSGADRRPNILFAISDDQTWLHTGIAGDKVVKTPSFDRVAREGVLFTRAFCASPSCTPSRGAILTGQTPWRLRENGNLWSTLRKEFPVYPDLLEAAGYHVGYAGKGWSPGNVEPGGRTRNPAGPFYKDFASFLKRLPDNRPFCFWFGSQDPHRPYEKGSGAASGMKIDDVVVPPFLPDVPEVRSDILDYCLEIERFDRQVGQMIRLLEHMGKLDNTLVVITSDNGMPFPRAKANLYDYGTRLPLAVRWPAQVKPGRIIDDFISFTDYAPTFLETAGLKPPADMTGRSFLDLLTSDEAGRVDPARDKVFTGRERHAWCRADGLGYPCRAVRTERFLYVRNFEPDRWPAGDPDAFGDIDDSPTKAYMKAESQAKRIDNLFRLAFEKRPAEELYDLREDPAQMQNVATLDKYADAKKTLRAQLDRWMAGMKDPRASGLGDEWDRYPYYGARRTAPASRRGATASGPSSRP